MNDITTAKIQFSTPSPLGGSLVPSPIVVQAPHRGSSFGDIDVPQGSGPSAKFQIPFGSVSLATAVFIQNKTSVAITVEVGEDESETAVAVLPPGGIQLTMGAGVVATAAVPINVSCNATAEEPGKIAFMVVGDEEETVG